MKKAKGSTQVMKNAWNILSGALYDFKKSVSSPPPPSETPSVSAEEIYDQHFQKGVHGDEEKAVIIFVMEKFAGQYAPDLKEK